MEVQQTGLANIASRSRGHGGAGRTAGAIEAKKEALVEKAREVAAGLLEADQRATAERLLAAFYEHVPPVDVAERSPRDLCSAALSLWRFAERRRQGQAKIRVFDPNPNADGWSSPHTAVNCC